MDVVARTVGAQVVRRIPRVLLLLLQGGFEVEASAGIQTLVLAGVMGGELELHEDVLARAPVPASGNQFTAELVRRGAVAVGRKVAEYESHVERRGVVVQLQAVRRVGLVVELQQTAPDVDAVVHDVAAEQLLSLEAVRFRDRRGEPQLVPHQGTAQEGLDVGGGVVLLHLVPLEEVRLAGRSERDVLRIDHGAVPAALALRQFGVIVVLGYPVPLLPEDHAFTVNDVRARLRDHVDDSAGGPAVLRAARGRLQRGLVDPDLRQEHPRPAAAGIGRVHAVHEDGALLPPGTVDARVLVGQVAVRDDARHQLEVGEVVRVDADDVRRDVRGNRAGGGDLELVDQRRLGRDRDLALRLEGHRQHDLGTGARSHVDRRLGRAVVVERPSDGVCARRQQGEPVAALGAGDRDLLAAVAGDRDRYPGHRVSVRVDRPAEDDPRFGTVRDGGRRQAAENDGCEQGQGTFHEAILLSLVAGQPLRLRVHPFSGAAKPENRKNEERRTPLRTIRTPAVLTGESYLSLSGEDYNSVAASAPGRPGWR